VTLLWLAWILAVIVFAAVFLTWDCRTQFRRQERARMLQWTRRLRCTEDRAWTLRQIEFERAMTLTLSRDLDSADSLLDALSTVPLEVVA
jgi:hypothetical protein